MTESNGRLRTPAFKSRAAEQHLNPRRAFDETHHTRQENAAVTQGG
jgi:hypothetical protein